MSFDVSLTVHTGPDTTALVWDSNITYNLGRMFKLALGLPDGIRSLDGRHAGTAAALISKAADRMDDNPGLYKPLNPPNGWGDYDTARDWMRKLGDACRTHPNACINVE
jgi:hypothetical protein